METAHAHAYFILSGVIPARIVLSVAPQLPKICRIVSMLEFPPIREFVIELIPERMWRNFQRVRF